MATRKPPAPGKSPARIGDQAVRAKTGRDWAAWFSTLDRAGAKGRTHREIVAIVGDTFGVGPWWRQMITVEYERARGQRAVNQVADGWNATVSRTFDAPLAALAGAFESPRVRASWLGVKGARTRSGTPGRVLRLDWPDGSRAEVRFTAKAGGRSAVAIEHTKLSGAPGVRACKAAWSEALERLRARLAR